MSRAKPLKAKADLQTTKKVASSVQAPNTPDSARLPSVADVDWSNLKFLVEVAEAGSLREAARRQKVSVNTVRAHLTRLERSLGTVLVRRELSGAKLTEAGDKLYEAAIELRRTMNGTEPGLDRLVASKTLTIGCTEGIGTNWLTPRIATLAKRIAPVMIDMQFDYDLQRDRSAVSDIGLVYRMPADSNLIVAKIATIHFMLFASPGYLAEHGTPQTTDDLRDHIFVEQSAPGYNQSAIDLLVGSDRPHSSTCIKTNSSLTQGYAAANGAGIVLMPSFVRAISNALVPLPVLPQMRMPLHFYYHAEAKASPVIRAAIDWLHEIFDPVRFPWFADDFVHPDDFQNGQLNEANVVQIFEHMIDRVAPIPRPPLRKASD